MKNIKLKNKIAVVTGACGGIGSALIKRLVENQVFCIMIDINKNLNSDLGLFVNQDKGEYFSIDLTNTQEINKFCSNLSSKFKRIDFLYNIAGVGIYKKIEDLTIEEWNLSLNLNLTAPFYLTKKLINLLQISDAPLVFNVGSGMGVMPTVGRSAYCSSKFGLRGLTLSLAKEFKGKKIKFQLLTLGSVMTGFGTGGVTRKLDLQKIGKNYLTPESVSDKIIRTTLDKDSPSEIEFYPDGYKEENA